MIIGFEDTSYTVNEDDGQVSVNVVVMDGEVSGTVRIRIRTRDGTAECEGVHTSTRFTPYPNTDKNLKQQIVYFWQHVASGFNI